MDPVKRDTLIDDLHKRGFRPHEISLVLKQQGIRVSVAAIERVIAARHPK